MKIYAGAPAAARHYLAADRGRADDYYLAEGAGIGRRFTAGPETAVVELAPLSGEHYETWVAGIDPDTGQPRGRLRTDDRAVRFVEVVVNGPKSWSLAAALHPDIAAAYDAAQDRAAAQILGWLAEHATTRVGPAGGQVQIPVERLEAVTVRHYTSRAGDPHRHLHLQVNARVFAAGKWRGLHTVGVRDSLAAINGIGHAAVAADPQFRAALAAHGYRLGRTGEILQLAEYVGPFSARAAQIGRNADRYERVWTAAHPGETPGKALRRKWDARAWAEGRPDKVIPRPGTNLSERWLAELTALGYRDLDVPVTLTPTPAGVVARDAAAATVLARLGAARSAWNAADLRGEVEQFLAAQGVVADAAVRIELAEDVTARALARCLPLLTRDGAPVPVPEHIRVLTSQPVLDVEADLTARLAARSAAADPSADASLTQPVRSAVTLGGLDAGQAAAVTALTGTRSLVVVEGAAGAGKTTTLAATRTVLAEQGRGLMVVTPTLKAATVASTDVGVAAGSAAAFAHAYGWRWTEDGAWSRLDRGESDPVNGWIYMGPPTGARLRPGDLLVIDEAGMLNQDTARALLTVADECQVRVALLGDRRQLAAVGRGGVLDLAVDRVDPAAHLILDGVHRFTRTDAAGNRAPDRGYAELTLAMRTGHNPGAVFDVLVARGQIRLHPDPAVLQETLAQVAVTTSAQGQRPAIVADSLESVAFLNAAIRSALVAAGKVDDSTVATTFAGQRIGVGDRIATRRNDHHLGVANRDTWTVTDVGAQGRLVVTSTVLPPAHPAQSPAGSPFHTHAPFTRTGSGVRGLPADYVAAHVELAYASTAHGVQGDTVPAAHLVIGEHTGAASAYVGMTRGRETNTAHLIALDLEEAREQWIAVFARDRADLGPAHAAQLAAAETARYAPPRPLEQVLAELHAAWTDEQRDLRRLAALEPERDTLRQLVEIEAPHVGELAKLAAARDHAARMAEQARQRVEASAAVLTAQADHARDALLAHWDSERGAASAAARVIRDGPGRFGIRRGPVTRAGEQLTAWADRWRPHVPTLPTDPGELAGVAGWFDDREALWKAFQTSARAAIIQAHPEHADLYDAAQTAHAASGQARHDLTEARAERDQRLAPFGSAAWTPDPAGRLADLESDIAGTRQQLTDSQDRIAALTAEPALSGQPPDRLTRERDSWQTRRDTERHQRQSARTATQEDPVYRRRMHEEHHTRSAGRPGRGIGR